MSATSLRAHRLAVLAWVGLSVAGLFHTNCLSCAGAHGAPPLRGPVLRADPHYDERTKVAPSMIPGAGLGLFAVTRIEAGEVIGEFGGQLIEGPDLDNPSPYMIELPVCGFMRLPPYRIVDGRDHGSPTSRINFAPRTINGRETHFQNAKIDKICQPPWVRFVATRNIEAGAEIRTSYGPHYHYEGFMYRPAVRDYFCGLLGMDCRQSYEFEP